MTDCKPVFTPMSPGAKLSSSMAPSTPEDILFMKSVPYLSVEDSCVNQSCGCGNFSDSI